MLNKQMNIIANVQRCAISKRTTLDGDTPPPFWYAVFSWVLDGTQYAKGRYAVRKNPVISYADINFYFKKV